MEFLKLFISDYGTTIMYAILTAIAGYLGIVAKQLYTKYINDKTKQAVAKTVVQAVEQIYTDLHGKEKLNKALISAAEMLEEKGISITDLELRMLIEAAVAEFNDAFNKTGNTDTESPKIEEADGPLEDMIGEEPADAPGEGAVSNIAAE